jgi:hypothetical protein
MHAICYQNTPKMLKGQDAERSAIDTAPVDHLQSVIIHFLRIWHV